MRYSYQNLGDPSMADFSSRRRIERGSTFFRKNLENFTMAMTATLHDTSLTSVLSGIRWDRTERGVLVGRDGSTAAGRIQKVAGGYVAIDARGAGVGRFDTLREAKSALTGIRRPRRGLGEAAERTAFAVATVAGAVTSALALTAAVLFV
ncbi:hypothetical protein GCM10027411_06440 [Microbacterium aureliae]